VYSGLTALVRGMVMINAEASSRFPPFDHQ
jgi:hypothetical protein